MYSHSGLVWEPKIPPGTRPFPRDGLPRGIVTRAKLARHLEVRATGLGSPSLLFSPGRSFPTSTARARLPRPRREGRDGRDTTQRCLQRPPCASDSDSELRHPPSAATPPPSGLRPVQPPLCRLTSRRSAAARPPHRSAAARHPRQSAASPPARSFVPCLSLRRM